MVIKKNYIGLIILSSIFICGIILLSGFMHIFNLDFSVSECNHGSIDFYMNERTEPEYEWLDENTISVMGKVSINCADEISYGDYRIDGENLILKYHVKEDEEMSASCMCIHELTYVINYIEKKDYEIKIEEI